MHAPLHALAQAAIAVSLSPDSHWHGEAHWRGVADQGLWLAETLGWGRQERLFLFAFGAAHDCRRENEDHDPGHGPRAAQWMADHGWGHALGLSDSYDNRLFCALVGHDGGTVSSDALIGACWDADRSLLGRVGITPHPRYFSTATGGDLFDAMVERGEEVAENPASWDVLIERALA